MPDGDTRTLSLGSDGGGGLLRGVQHAQQRRVVLVDGDPVALEVPGASTSSGRPATTPRSSSSASAATRWASTGEPWPSCPTTALGTAPRRRRWRRTGP